MTLFQKYGGTPTVSRLVADFYQKVPARPHLKRHFDGAMAQLDAAMAARRTRAGAHHVSNPPSGRPSA
jgi:truncated hemoglobin YjbI